MILEEGERRMGMTFCYRVVRLVALILVNYLSEVQGLTIPYPVYQMNNITAVRQPRYWIHVTGCVCATTLRTSVNDKTAAS